MMDRVKNTPKPPIATLNCRGRLLVVDKPLVMGILNITPDSFYDGNPGKTLEDYIKQAGDMLRDGAVILDIGGQSTRPGSERIDAATETARVLPVIRAIREKFPEALVSIDTYHASVAEEAVGAGAAMVNDISAGDMDPRMIPAVASLGVAYVIMHMKGRPETMQLHAGYDDVARELIDYFILKTDACRKAGIHDLVIDPGFGFGKTITENFELLNRLRLFSIFGLPLMVGLSRKSTIFKTLGTDAAHALNGTTVMHTLALLNGAGILRVHDVKEAIEAIRLVNAYQGG